MPKTRLRRGALALPFACCVIAIAAVAAYGQQQEDNISKKTSGSLSAILRASPTPTPTISSTIATSQSGEIDPSFKQKELTSLNYTFRTRSGATFPANFRRFVPTQAQAATTGLVGTKMFSIAATSDEPLRVGVDVQDVISIEIERPQESGPIMDVSARNLGARKSHNVEEFNGEFPNVNGENVTAAVFDGGAVLGTHVEFRLNPQSPTPNRVQINTDIGIKTHATHVAGTLAAAGRAAEAKGMAPALRLVSLDWFDDLRKLEELAPTIQVSNHSYGPLAGWARDEFNRWRWWGDRQISGDEDSRFGKYTAREAQLDAMLLGFPNLVTIIAAGNDRDDGPPRQPIRHMVIEGVDWVESSEVHRVDGFDQGGLDTVVGLGLAKNAICIGAVDDITSTSGVNMISYSGWGPADDGRIKPDLVANGHHLLSTSNAGDDEYVDMSGTSMASPTAAGIAALLIQLYQRERGTPPTSSIIKAVMIHTARDAGEPGPDPVFGWGSIDALRAGRVIARKSDPQNFLHLIKTDEVAEGQSKDLVMTLGTTGDPIKVTVVWTDPPGSENLGGLDDATPTLVNDLDAKLIAPDGQEFFPYSLDRADPVGQARRDRANHVDNVEVIEGAGPMTGEWKVRVTGTRLRSGQRQSYALIVSGLKPL